MPKADMGAMANRFSPTVWADPEVVPYAARVSVWGRWFIGLVSAFEISYRPGFWYPDGWGLDLPMVSFHCANLSRANLLNANLSGAIFQDAVAANAWLVNSDLSSASFLRADLSGAKLMKADLSNAQFLEADLNKADISDANLSGAEFSIGGPQTAKGLNRAQLDEARADPDNPPKLTGVLDAASSEPLVWRGKPLCGGA